MFFLWWKKYEGSFRATVASIISFWGTIILFFVPLIIVVIIDGSKSNFLGSLGNIGNIIGIFLYFGLFIGLKILLNILTDKIAGVR